MLVHSPAFARGHAEANAQPVAHGSELLEFDVVLQAEKSLLKVMKRKVPIPILHSNTTSLANDYDCPDFQCNNHCPNFEAFYQTVVIKKRALSN